MELYLAFWTKFFSLVDQSESSLLQLTELLFDLKSIICSSISISLWFMVRFSIFSRNISSVSTRRRFAEIDSEYSAKHRSENIIGHCSDNVQQNDIKLVLIKSPFSSQCNRLSFNSYIGSKMNFWWTNCNLNSLLKFFEAVLRSPSWVKINRIWFSQFFWE